MSPLIAAILALAAKAGIALAPELESVLAGAGVPLAPEIESVLVALLGRLESFVSEATSKTTFDADMAAMRITNADGQLANDEADEDGALLQKFPPSK
jgi:hypothetical protein